MLYLSNYAHLQVKDELTRMAGVGAVAGLRRRRIQHARLARSRSPRLAAAHDQRRRPRHPRAERPGGGRRAGRAAGAVRRDLSALDQHPGPSHHRVRVRQHRRPRDRRRADHAALGRGPPRARIEPLFAAQPARQQAGGRDRRLPAPGHQRAPGLAGRARDTMERLKAELPAGRRLPHRLRPDGVRPRVDRRGRAHAVRGDPARRHRRDRLPADVARLDHSARRRAGVADRHLRGDARPRLLAQHAVALRPGARHRHRRGRCDRRGGERRAAHRAGAAADGGDATGDGGSLGTDHRDRAGARARCSCRRRSSAA